MVNGNGYISPIATDALIELRKIDKEMDIGFMKYTLKWYWLRYLTYWAGFMDGLIGILTFGVYCPYWCLWTNCKFMDYNEKMILDNSQKYGIEDSYEQFRK